MQAGGTQARGAAADDHDVMGLGAQPVRRHRPDPSRRMRAAHTLLPMTQEAGLDAVIRQRIRGLRLARGWSLDSLAARCYLSPSTLSRIETGHRRIALDQLVPIARALGTTLDQLVEPAEDEDVVIRPAARAHARADDLAAVPRARAPRR